MLVQFQCAFSRVFPTDQSLLLFKRCLIIASNAIECELSMHDHDAKPVFQFANGSRKSQVPLSKLHPEFEQIFWLDTVGSDHVNWHVEKNAVSLKLVLQTILLQIALFDS